jgi:asparagine synthase (glutamine-hydrolysing)
MCGIAVILDRSGSDAAVRCARMLRSMVHRGPDGQGQISRDLGQHQLQIGHRRLAIIDLSDLGHQPMECGPAVISFNGEIYNYRALRRQLADAGHIFRSHSDTEVLLAGYLQWGADVLRRARGMFALALWDDRSRKLIVARDFIGMKPLYYRLSGDCFAAASDLRGLASAFPEDMVLDRAGLASLLAYGSVAEPLTVWKDVRMLPPASWMELELVAGRIQTGPIQGYWDYPAGGFRSDPKEGKDRLRQAVVRHLESDVPVAVFLSAGVDSTAVAEVAAAEKCRELLALTVGFPGVRGLDEAATAAQTAAALGIQHRSVVIGQEQPRDWFCQWIDSLDQPSLDGLNTFLISGACHREGIKVALSGLGGDEGFGGYQVFRTLPRWMAGLRAIAWGDSCSGGRLGNMLRCLGGTRGLVRYRRHLEALSESPGTLAEAVLWKRRLFRRAELQRMGIDEQSLDCFGLPIERPRPVVWDRADSVDVIRRMEADFYMRDTLLRVSDQASMAHSLELRLPLLDQDLWEWAMGQPIGTTRQPLKQALVEAAGPWTMEASRRPKRGFTLPYRQWLLGPLRETMLEGIDALGRYDGLVNRSYLHAVADSLNAGRLQQRWSAYWMLGVLGQWMHRYVDPSGKARS